jgi:hypothetical protein
MNKLLVISIIIGLVFIPTFNSNNYFYIFLIPTYLSFGFLNRQFLKQGFYSIQGLISILYLLVWSYGFIRGLVMQNPTISIISNFAGMVAYAHFFLIKTDKNSIEKMLTLVFWIGVLNMALGFCYTAYSLGSGELIFTISSLIGGDLRIF